MESKAKKSKAPLFEKAVVAWMKYDPFVALVVGNDHRVRRDVMLNLLGREAAIRHFGAFPQLSPEDGPIFPETVRNAVTSSLGDPKQRSRLIAELIYWATDPGINNRYIKSHLTRLQIVSDLLGPVFFNATPKQEEAIMMGLKYMLAKKPTTIAVPGEQSYTVLEEMLCRVIELLVHNQKVIINKAISEAEEKMRIHLLRQIQELRGEKHTTPTFSSDLITRTQKLIKEKFPLRQATVKHLEEILDFYLSCKWSELQAIAKDGITTIREIRKPLTLTEESVTR